MCGNLFRNCDLDTLPLGSLLRLYEIEYYLCAYNYNLRFVLIPANVVGIAESAFEDCVSLVEVDFVLPSKLASIASMTFRGCESLTHFRIVGSVQRIDGNFLQDSGVRQVTVDEENTQFDAIEGFIVSRDRTSIVCSFGNDSNVRIGANVETVGEASFLRCGSLRSVTFESGSKLRLIEKNAFAHCRSLERVQFGGSCPCLGPDCFTWCAGLKEVLTEPPSEPVPLGSPAFSGCHSLNVESAVLIEAFLDELMRSLK
jgi:hypothetical protein